MKDVDDSIVRVRSAVRLVRTSPAMFGKFKIVVRAIGIECKKGLYFDIPTR